MKFPSLTYDVHDDPDFFNVFVMAEGIRVGQLLVERVGANRARLSDVKVMAKYKRRWTLTGMLTNAWRHGFSPIELRNRGMGADLLNRLAEWCENRQIDEVYGSVVQSDLQETPSLPGWYEKRGFNVGPPSGECLPHAVKMVVWRRHSTSAEGG